MTAEQARAEVFGDLPTVTSGYIHRCEPVTGRAFTTFAGIAPKEPGERPAEGSIQPTEAEAMRVHVEALKPWLADLVDRCKRPTVCVRMWPEAQELTNGGWLAATRLLVTEGGRDVEAKVEAMFPSLHPDAHVAPSMFRDVVVADQPIVGVTEWYPYRYDHQGQWPHKRKHDA